MTLLGCGAIICRLDVGKNCCTALLVSQWLRCRHGDEQVESDFDIRLTCKLRFSPPKRSKTLV